jgi:hypothetical protein
MEKTLPYISAYGNIEKCLDRIIDAQTPKVFSQDFLATYLSLTGGGARPVIKYLKKCGVFDGWRSANRIVSPFQSRAK